MFQVIHKKWKYIVSFNFMEYLLTKYNSDMYTGNSDTHKEIQQ